LIKLKKIKDLAEDVHELKSLQRIIDSEEMVYKSYAVSCLYPEKVNTSVWNLTPAAPAWSTLATTHRPSSGPRH